MGRRNRQRGAELQRQVVNLAKEYDLIAHNRDRGGAQHEQGDVEIEENFYGCKRRKSVPAWVMPEKEEQGVFFRADQVKVREGIASSLNIDIASLNNQKTFIGLRKLRDTW